MIVVEIGISKYITRYSNMNPFIFQFTVNIKNMYQRLIGLFGIKDPSTDEKNNILSVHVLSINKLSRVNSVNEVMGTFRSYTYDFDRQTIIINYGPTYNPLLDYTDYQRAVGFSDKAVIYIDDTPYLPVIKSSPLLSTSQDMINYDQLSYNTGGVDFANQGGSLDFLNEMTLFSNDVNVYYLEYNGGDEYTRADLIPLAYFLFLNSSVGLQGGKIDLQDPRKANNVKLPNVLFSASSYPDIEEEYIDKPIPLLFGSGSISAVCTNGTKKQGLSTYRAALSLQLASSIQIYRNDSWEDVSPYSIQLSLGEITLTERASRGIEFLGNWDAALNQPTLNNTTGIGGSYYLSVSSGTVDFGSGERTVTAGQYAYFENGEWEVTDEVKSDAYKCRITSAYGFDGSNPIEVIKKLEEIGNGIPYTDSFYDISEIEAEKTGLGAVSLYIDEEIELNEIIRTLQEGSANRFRYEFSPTNMRTLRKDNPNREKIFPAIVGREEILEYEDLSIYTDKDTIAASIKVNYGNDFTSDKRSSVVDLSSEAEIAKSIREKPQITFDTYIPTRESAIARAALESARLGKVRRYTDLTLRGKKYLFLRIYDMLEVELIDKERKWVGTWLCQVLKLRPDTDKMSNSVTLALERKTGNISLGKTLRITTDGNIRLSDTNRIRWIK